LLAGGGYAEYVAVPAGQIMPIPARVSLHDAAGLPEVACTVWSNLVLTANLQAGQTLLIHGGASGIGTHAIQVAHALGATVAVTAGSTAKLDLCRELGADITISYRDEDFVARINAETGGADVIFDIMGASYLDRNLDALAADGQLVVIGMQGGVKGELNFGKLIGKRARVIGTAGRIDIEDDTLVVTAEGREERRPCPPALSDGSQHPDWFTAVADEFLARLEARADRATSPNLEEAAVCVAIECLARESSRRGGERLALRGLPSSPARAGAAG